MVDEISVDELVDNSSNCKELIISQTTHDLFGTKYSLIQYSTFFAAYYYPTVVPSFTK